MDSISTSNGTTNAVVSIQSGVPLEEINGEIVERKQILASSERKIYCRVGTFVVGFALMFGCMATCARFVKSYNLSIFVYLVLASIVGFIYIYMLRDL